MFTGAAGAGCALRRKIFYRRAQHESVLPADMSGAHVQGRKHPLFPDGGSGCGSWISSVLAVPAGMFAGNFGMRWDKEHGGAGAAADRRERSGRRRSGSAGGAVGSWLAPSAAAVSAAPGRDTERRGANAPATFCEKIDRRVALADDAGGDRFRIRLRAEFQRMYSQSLPSHAKPDSAPGWKKCRAGHRPISFSSSLPAALQLGTGA
jgi:hypothetical protein